MKTMSRAPYQVLVLPYYRSAGGTLKYAILQRSDFPTPCWQGLAGGGEGEEAPLAAARREAFEEGSISSDRPMISLDSLVTIPVHNFGGFIWGPLCYVIPEYSFGVELESEELTLSDEHLVFRWENFDTAHALLKWDSNKNALWELNQRIMKSIPPQS